MESNNKDSAILFGPFSGELSWEFYRFAPYLIYLKKINPDIKTVVYSRSQRIDLYGQNANIFVPLKLKDDKPELQEKFRLIGLEPYFYRDIGRLFKDKYAERFDIKGHFYPDIFNWRYKVKWQFPRDQMDYNFLPRRENMLLVERLTKDMGKCCLYCLDKEEDIDFLIHKDYLVYTPETLEKKINNLLTMTALGVLIEYIKKCSFVVSNFYSTYFHLALLLNRPVITTAFIHDTDALHLLNPLKTNVIFNETLRKGIKSYETNI